jgi:hypothetical protein
MTAGPAMKNLLLSVIDQSIWIERVFRVCENSTLISAGGCQYVLFQRVEGEIGENVDTIVTDS